MGILAAYRESGDRCRLEAKADGHNSRRDGGFDAETGGCLSTVQGTLDAGIEIDTAAYHKSGSCRLKAKASSCNSSFNTETGVCLGLSRGLSTRVSRSRPLRTIRAAVIVVIAMVASMRRLAVSVSVLSPG